MAILAECRICHRRQRVENKKCVSCEASLDKQKQAGRLKYWIVYRLQGKQVWEPAIGENGKNLSIADTRAAEGKRLGQRKEKVITILNVRPQQVTFNELAEWYFKQEHVKDRENKERDLKDFNADFGDRPVDAVTNSDLLNYQARLKREGKADRTVDGKICSVRTVVNQAVKDKKISHEVADTFSLVKKLLKKDSNVKEAIISFEQFNRLHEAIRQRSRDPLNVNYWTGMREGEVLNLRPSRIFLEDRLIKLREEDTKERKAKDIPITDELYPTLSKLCEKGAPDQRIFAVNKDQFIRDVKEASKKIGLTYGRSSKDGFTAHSLRHTYKTNAMRANIPQAVRMRISGHSSPEMDLRYTHPQLDDLRTAMEKINQFVKGGHVVSEAEASPALKAILEKLDAISKSVSKNVDKLPSDQQKEVSQISANPLN